MSLSKKQALLFCILAISSFAATLYLATFAGVLLFVYQNGELLIKADSLMLAESILLPWCTIVSVFITVYSVSAIVSQLKRKEKAYHEPLQSLS